MVNPKDAAPIAEAMGRPGAIGLARNAPHLHAALLFADFLLSVERQEMIKQRNREPASNAVGSSLNKFPYQIIDPAMVLDEAVKWEKFWPEIFLKGQHAGRRAD